MLAPTAEGLTSQFGPLAFVTLANKCPFSRRTLHEDFSGPSVTSGAIASRRLFRGAKQPGFRIRNAARGASTL